MITTTVLKTPMVCTRMPAPRKPAHAHTFPAHTSHPLAKFPTRPPGRRSVANLMACPLSRPLSNAEFGNLKIEEGIGNCS